MKVLIISDTHGKNDFPNLIKEVKPDFTIHAGDVIDFHDHTT
jgi:predicted phosphodiesterase